MGLYLFTYLFIYSFICKSTDEQTFTSEMGANRNTRRKLPAARTSIFFGVFFLLEVIIYFFLQGSNPRPPTLVTSPPGQNAPGLTVTTQRSYDTEL